jgi:plasmid rolling circle replication initiator protein Rep
MCPVESKFVCNLTINTRSKLFLSQGTILVGIFRNLYVEIAKLSNSYIAQFHVKCLLTENTYYVYSGFFC